MLKNVLCYFKGLLIKNDDNLPKRIFLSLLQLIKRCWDENPGVRPTFGQVKTTLYNINPNKRSPVDIMMQLMEKYSKHLETLVAERTQDLMLEKQKTDRLLYSKFYLLCIGVTKLKVRVMQYPQIE